MNTRKFLWIAVASVAVAAFLHILPLLGIPLENNVLFTARWWAVGALCIYGYNNNKLTTWILISMAVGMAVGYDFPKIGGNLEVLSKIFIQLIKTVIAPLLFGTLVVGIAGQRDSKQVGRMSVKAFSYFIAATSVALVVGLIAINMTRAGDLPEEIKARSIVAPVTVLPASDLSVQLGDA